MLCYGWWQCLCSHSTHLIHVLQSHDSGQFVCPHNLRANPVLVWMWIHYFTPLIQIACRESYSNAQMLDSINRTIPPYDLTQDTGCVASEKAPEASPQIKEYCHWYNVPEASLRCSICFNYYWNSNCIVLHNCIWARILLPLRPVTPEVESTWGPIRSPILVTPPASCKVNSHAIPLNHNSIPSWAALRPNCYTTSCLTTYYASGWLY